MSLTKKLRIVARSNGFDLIGFINKYYLKCFSDYSPIGHKFKQKTIEPGSVVIVGISDLKFFKDSHKITLMGKIARSYAAGHEFDLTDELQPIITFLHSEGFQARLLSPNHKLYSISLKKLALHAGLGWQGYNSLIINPTFGSFVTYGAFITNAEFRGENTMLLPRCGKCMKCINSCPTKAIVKPFIVESSKCLDRILNSPGIIDDGTKHLIGNRILSCDICQEVCPYNVAPVKNLTMNGPFTCEFKLSKLIRMNKIQFITHFGNLKWSIDYNTFIRNIIIALGNSDENDAIQIVDRFIKDNNKPIQDAAKWAFKKLQLLNN